MQLLFKKSGMFITRGILSLLALFCIALIALQIILVVGINAASTGRGTAFLSEKANEALKESGYEIHFDALYYDPVQGISIRNVALSDAAGPFLQIDRFSLNLSFILGPLRTLNISANGGTLRLSRLPMTKGKPAEENGNYVEAFNAPDIYFRRISFNKFSFKRVVIEEPVAGQIIELSPLLKADISLNKEIGLTLQIKPSMQGLFGSIEAPQQIDFAGSLNSNTLDFSVDRLSVQAPSYNIAGEGTGNLSRNGTVQISAKAEHKDLTMLTQNAVQEASAQFTRKGPISGPAIDLQAMIVTASLKERGLSDILINVKTGNIEEGLKGFAKAQSAFHGNPITLAADLSYDAPSLNISAIKERARYIADRRYGVFTDTSLLDGSVALSAKDLSRYKDLAGINIAGKMEVKSMLKANDSGKQAVDIDISASNIVADTIKIKSLIAGGSIASLDHPWPQSAKIQLAGLQISDNMVLDRLDASVTEDGSENYKLFLKGNGHMPKPLSFDGAADISNITQAIPAFENIDFSVRQGKSSAQISGDFSEEQVNLSLTAKDFQGNDIPADLPPQLDKLLIDINASVTGNPAQPKTNLSAELRGLGAGSYKNATIKINAHMTVKVDAHLTGDGVGIRKLDVAATTPLTWGLLPFHFTFDQSAALHGTMAANLDLGAISPIFMPPTQSLSGTLVADGTLSGTVFAPEPNGSIGLDNVKFEDGESGILIDRLFASAKITQNSLLLESLSATDGKEGTIKGSGKLSFDGSAANIDLHTRNFNAPRSELANGIINADMLLRGNSGKLDLTGRAEILEMDVLIPEKFSSSIPQLNIVEDEKEEDGGLLENLTLNITIGANNQIFVRGWGLDAEFGGDIAITGTAIAPQFNGGFTSKRGRFEEFGKRFKLERANLQFQGTIPPSPYLDVEATTPAGDVTGSILMTGSVQSPSITFASTPALPEDEVLSRILFGKDSAKISPFQAVQLAQTIRRFSGEGGGGFDPLAAIRSATGLDDISVETDESGGTNIGAGKYLTDNVYLELGTGKAENSGEATIQVELTPSINIESEIGQDAQGGGGIFWKHDY